MIGAIQPWLPLLPLLSDINDALGKAPPNAEGPVVFPMPPTDGPMESSGVVIGASGFGFVPPNGGSSANFAYGRRRYF
ncbi:hypothetical protein PVAND_001135 [Polypedilum vanderplanki]|uniref:Uncharacterized protein n=1 Tax=Polypedilum vanderplanki TaxID=319348 RepID=A0A9J6BMB0_POLVA|nr:hypothetical protein PVAND_001135 [Polypedilum vanderplanki]